MKIYLVLGIFEWESTDVLGVYSTKEKAEQKKSTVKNNFDSIEIEEYTIDE